MELTLPCAEVVSEYLDLMRDSVWYALGRSAIDFTQCDRAGRIIDLLQKEIESVWDTLPATEKKFEVFNWIFLNGHLYFSKMDGLDVAAIIDDGPRFIAFLKSSVLEFA